VAVKSDDKQNKVKYGDVFFTTSSETLNEIGFSSVLTKKVKDVINGKKLKKGFALFLLLLGVFVLSF
jgi:hypothetical protein